MIHKSITKSRIVRAIKSAQRHCDEYPGFCLNCGKKANNCEPDARDYRCEKCGQNRVFGAEEILMSGSYSANE